MMRCLTRRRHLYASRRKTLPGGRRGKRDRNSGPYCPLAKRQPPPGHQLKIGKLTKKEIENWRWKLEAPENRNAVPPQPTGLKNGKSKKFKKKSENRQEEMKWNENPNESKLKNEELENCSLAEWLTGAAAGGRTRKSTRGNVKENWRKLRMTTFASRFIEQELESASIAA